MPGYYPTPRPSTYTTVPSGNGGIRATLGAMVRLTREGRKDPGVRQLAASLVRNLPQYDRLGEVAALHAFVRDAIRYTNDPNQVELLQTPRCTLETGVGDCDDKSTLLGSLLESVGRPARYVAIGMGGRPLSHVLVETRVGKGWLPLETIQPVGMGWYPPNVTSRMVAHV